MGRAAKPGNQPEPGGVTDAANVANPAGATKAASPSDAADPTTRAILRHWRQAVPNDRMAHLVRDAARGVTRGLQMRLAQYNVSFGHWVFLRILWEGDGLTQRELSERAGLMESTTHTALRKMSDAGYIERRNLDGNQRKQHVFLTTAGRSLKAKLVPLAELVNDIATQGIDEAEIAITRKTLLTMITNLADDEYQEQQSGRQVPSTQSFVSGKSGKSDKSDKSDKSGKTANKGKA